VNDLVVTKVLDAASVKLLEACLQGKVFPKATLTLERGGGRPEHSAIWSSK
jgi:type VI protein secretion system component Hcp